LQLTIAPELVVRIRHIGEYFIKKILFDIG